jgi:Neurotransmitter-gated ion-channel ligand binding domain
VRRDFSCSYSPNVSCDSHIVSITGADDKIIFSKVRIYNTGDVVWLRVGQFSSSCNINVEWFPFDQQTCDMTFVSWDDGSQVLLDDSGPFTSPQEPEYDGEWKIVGKLKSAGIFFTS